MPGGEGTCYSSALSFALVKQIVFFRNAKLPCEFGVLGGNALEVALSPDLLPKLRFEILVSRCEAGDGCLRVKVISIDRLPKGIQRFGFVHHARDFLALKSRPCILELLLDFLDQTVTGTVSRQQLGPLVL